MTPTLQYAASTPSTIAGYGIAIARALEYRGVDSGRTFEDAGLSLPQVNDPLQRISVKDFSRLYQSCQNHVHDPYFGLVVSEFIRPSNLHAVGYALWASSTLREFCDRLTRYARVLTSQANVALIEEGGEFGLTHVMLPETTDESEDAWLGFLVRAARSLCRPELNPLRVEMRRPQPQAGDAPFRKLFRAPVTFGNSRTTIVFDRADIDVPLNGACPELAQVNDNIAASYLGRLAREDIVATTRAKIIDLLPSGRCCQSEIASSLGFASATLKHKLGQRGTSFLALVDEIRVELGMNYLRQHNLSITEITFRLGFTDTSNFNRAFKRWTGLSPTTYRQSL